MNNEMDEAKRLLIDELSNEQGNINILRIRNLCRDHPGIISTTGLRLRIWSLLLLGQEDSSIEQGKNNLLCINNNNNNNKIS